MRRWAVRGAVAAMLCAWAAMVTPRVAWSAAGDSLVRCESSARETVRCKADTRGGVTLQRQLSRAGCWYDETWGYDSKGIWVSNGCRADFALGTKPVVGAPSGSGAAAPSGSSGISGTDVAMGAAAVLVVGAIAAAVLSNRGDDDDDEDDDRCRRRDRRGRCLDSYDDDDDYYGDGDPWRRDQRVQCESQGNKERYCRVETRRGVELYRQLSEARCRYGSTWGYDRHGIWVDRGCRAEFVIRG
jgi:Protein of unknown function (DUF3011)